MTKKDSEILRRLAGRVADIAARPIEQEKRDLWYRHNSLEPTCPLVFCDPENGWNEIITPQDLECEGEQARGWELGLRREIFSGDQMRDDRVILPFFYVSHANTESGWGMQETYTGAGAGGAYVWDAPLKTYDDLNKLRFPEITLDYPTTERGLELAEQTLGDILTVRLKSVWWWSFGMTWPLVRLRGLEQVMYDMVESPDDLHRLMAFLRDAHLHKLQFLEENGLLSLNNDGTYVGSGGFGWTEELPASDFQGRVRACDMWGFAESQETLGVSPEMFEEFVFGYQLPILERFGLTCYGCCEPLDKRWSVLRRIPNLRRVSVSPWSDLGKMAENLADRYIFSMKPNPADLARPTFDEERIRADLRRALEITRGCRVEIVMKDNHTIGRDPQRVISWVRIAREEAERAA